MTFTIKPIAELNSDEIDKLADLHISVMHTLLSDLGKPIVLRYYQLAHKHPDVIGLCALSDDGDILGWATGSANPADVNKQLRLPLPWFFSQLLRLVFSHPGIILDLIGSLISTSKANQIKADQLELTYIGIANDAQGRGMGKLLLNAFLEAAHQANYKSIALSVETENMAAISLYSHSGFAITQTFREGRFERHRMEIFLS
ncbi:MAG: GNAT family N-acetyltransferase [Chloroflexota bacterium]